MAKRQIADEEERLKRQARRRLIGAVALATAVVVVLPLVLDSEPRPVGQNIELKIPDKDNAGQFNPKIDLPPADNPAAEQVAVSPVVVSPAVAPEVVPPAPAPEAKPVAPEKPAPVQAKEPEPKPAPVKKESKPAPAKSKPAVKRSEQGDSRPTSGYIVQVGAYKNANTAHDYMGNLRLQGFNAYTEKSGRYTRVRIGPYSSRSEAEAASRKIEKTQGLHSNIIHLK